jgi:hypothetical protein
MRSSVSWLRCGTLARQLRTKKSLIYQHLRIIRANFVCCADTLRAASAPPPEGSRRPAAPMWGQVLDMLQERGCIGPELQVGLLAC